MARVFKRILIVDDHPLFIDALKLALAPLTVGAALYKATTLLEAVAFLNGQPVDLVLLDLMLPDAGGVERIAKIRETTDVVSIVVVSGRDDPVTVSLARALGADGFISKASPLTKIQTCLRDLIAGKDIFPSNFGPLPLADAVAALTPAQARVLAAAATGKLNKQIAYEMNLAEPTIKAHMSAIFKRLGVHNRTQAILAVNEKP